MKTTLLTLSVAACLLMCGRAVAQPMHMPDRSEIPPGYVQVDGDIIMHAEDVIDDGFGPRSVFNPGTVWPNNRIPIEFDSNVSAAHRTFFTNSVLTQWTSVSSLTFPARSGESAYLHVMGDSSICGFDFATSSGYTGGRVEIHISQSATNCGSDGWNQFQLVHEVGHVMGYQHEQGRDDRNSYILVEQAHISDGQADQFRIYDPQRHYGPYDFDSNMHYFACAFTFCTTGCQASDATCRTITVLPPYDTAWQGPIGSQTHLSLMDKKIASFMYCPSDWRFLDPGQTNSARQGNMQEPYLTFSEALQHTPAGGTIQIAPGNIHVGPVPRIINQAVTLRAALWDGQMDPNTGSIGPSPSGYTTFVP